MTYHHDLATNGVQILKDISYLGSTRQETLDLYLPPGSPTHPLPTVVLIHGGSWAKGDKASPRLIHLAQALVREGFICASVNFLLATNTTPSWPTCLLDCKTAIQFLRVRADEYGIDARSIGVIGGSWGGYLVALVAATGDQSFRPQIPYSVISCRVQAAIAMYAPLDPMQLIAPGKLTQLFGATRDELPEAYLEANPTTHLTRNHPPLLLLHSSNDTNVPVDQTLSYAAHLQTLEIEHTVVIIPDTDHLPDQVLLLPHIVAFLKTHLGH